MAKSFLTYIIIEIISNCFGMAVEGSEVMMRFFLDLNLSPYLAITIVFFTYNTAVLIKTEENGPTEWNMSNQSELCPSKSRNYILI